MPKLRLFITAYSEPKLARQQEYAVCLERNLVNPAIDEICVLVEGDPRIIPSGEKIKVRPISGRPRFADFFDWIDDLAGLDDVSIIANTDIWFGPELALVRRTLNHGQCYALSRWDGDTLIYRNDSQDCWIFRGVIRNMVSDFPIGVARCDNRLLYELAAAGYEVLNPAFSIVAHHVHAGDRPEYGENQPGYVAPPYRYLWPHNLFGPVRTALHNLRYPEERVRWRFDKRRFRASFPIRALTKAGRRAAGVIGGTPVT